MPGGFLEVGLSEDGREVIINHPDLQPDENGVGHIVFSADEARALGILLLNRATECGYPAKVPLVVLPERAHRHEDTGIYVRAQKPDGEGFGTFDIAELDGPSLLAWLRSRGGHNPWAESVMLVLMGHEVPQPP